MNLQKRPTKEKGVYILILRMEKSETICIGKAGIFHFQKGFYAYVGSAMGPGGIRARVHHHLFSSAKPHWHMDYLKQKARIVEVWWAETKKKCEHDWATTIKKIPDSMLPAMGFGSTDCQCPTHLHYFRKKPRLQEFQKRFKSNLKPEFLMKVRKPAKGESP